MLNIQVNDVWELNNGSFTRIISNVSDYVVGIYSIYQLSGQISNTTYTKLFWSKNNGKLQTNLGYVTNDFDLKRKLLNKYLIYY